MHSVRSVTRGDCNRKAHDARIGRLLLSTAMIVVMTANAYAAGGVVTTNTTLTGVINGNKGNGYFLQSGTLTINNATLKNFETVGGNGSGGGAGLGGVIFINTGATTVLNNVNFYGNIAKGGNSVTGAIAGGALNGLNFSSGIGAGGSNGITPQDNNFLVGDGNGDGLNGNNGLDGASSLTGQGGKGGVGGGGEAGWSNNPLLENALALATVAEITAAVDLSKDSDKTALDLVECTSTTVVGPPDGDAAYCAESAFDGVVVLKDTANLAAATDALTFATGQVAAWKIANNQGSLGYGGNGGNGGSGGNSGVGVGGGVGGNGGAGGARGGNAQDGAGGVGGSGGIGGFGAGGGSGGNGGGSNTSSLTGAAGAGGVGGLFAGAGNNGTGYNATIQEYGGGGSGLGGAIFVKAGGTLIINGNALFDGGQVIGGLASKLGTAGSADGSDIFMMAGATLILNPGDGGVQTFNGTIDDDSMGSPLSGTYSGTVERPMGQGAGLTIESGHVNFNGGNLYSGNTIITGGVLEAADGGGLPSASNLQFNGAGTSGGVLETNGSFIRYLGTDAYLTQWTGSGGFAADQALDAFGHVVSTGLDVSLNGGQQLVWNQDSFVPTGNALIFGAADATDVVTWENDIDLDGTNNTILVTANAGNTDTAAMNGVLSDGALTIGDATHTGILILTAANTYAGTTTINGGQLVLTGSGSIADSSNIIINNGTLDISGTTAGTSLTTLSGAGNVNLGAQTLTLTNASGSYGGVISGTGGLEVAGGSETLTGINTYTGATTIDPAAILALAAAGSVATSSGVIDNGIFDISATSAGAKIATLSGNGSVVLGAENLTITNGSTEFDGVISGGGELKITGGSQTLGGVNTYTGLTVIDAGDPPGLFLTGTGSIATSSGVVDNSIFDISATSAGASITTLTGNGMVNLGAQTLTLTAAAQTFAGVIGGTGGFTVAAGAETLTGTNTYTGVTTINGGATLALTGTGAIAASSQVAANGTFDISGTSNGATITSLTGTGLVNLGAQTMTISNSSDTFAGVVQGSGGVTVAGGTQTLTGNNTYTGKTVIKSGAVMVIAVDGAISYSSEVQADGKLDIASTNNGAAVKTLSGTGKVALGAKTLSITNGSTTFAGVASGTGGIAVTGGSETLTGANTYTGQTSITNGAKLALSGAGAIAASSQVVDNGIFDISADPNGASIVTLSGGGMVVLGSKTLTVTNGSTNFAGVISGTGGLTAAGGTQTLSGVNTYTGATTINSGATLALSGTGSVLASSGVADAGTFDISATSNGASIKTLSGAGAVALGAQKLTLTTASGTYSGAIGGTGGVAITGGVESFTGTASTYGGGTTVTNAELKVAGNGSLGAATGSITLNNGRLTALNSFASTRAILLAGTTSTLNTNANTITVNGLISGTGALTAAGGGTLVLNNTADTYSGGTTVIENTNLIIAGDGALGATTGALVVQSGTVTTNGDITSSRPVTIDAGGSFNANGHSVDFTGPVNIDNGNGPVALYTSGVTLTGNWSYSKATGLIVNGTLSGVGTISQPTTINGTISPGFSPGTLTFTAPVTLTSAATYAIDIDGPGTGTGAGNYDRTVVTGAGNTYTAGGTMVVKLRGITGSANNTFTPVVGQTFDVVNTQAGVLGSFSGIVQPASGLPTGTQIDAVYSANDVNLVVTPISYAHLSPLGVTDTINRVSLGGAIDSYRLTPGVRMTGDRNTDLTALYTLPSGSIGAAMDQVAGTVHGDVMHAAVNMDRMLTSAIDDHRRARADGTEMSAWAVGLGEWATTGTDGNAPGYRVSAGGLAFGVDVLSSGDSKLGVTGSYGRSTVHTANAASATVQSERIGAYGSSLLNDWSFDAALTAGVDEYDSARMVALGSLVRAATGKSDGFGLSADGAVHFNGWDYVSPFAEVRDDMTSRSSFTEAGVGGLSLQLADETLNTPRSLLGVDMHVGDAKLNFSARLAWAHDYGQVAGMTDAVLTGSPLVPFRAYSSTIGHDAGVAHIALSSELDTGLVGYVEYSGEAREHATAQSVFGGLRFNW